MSELKEEKVPIIGRLETIFHGYRLRIDIAKNPVGIEVICYLMIGNDIILKKKGFINLVSEK